MEVRERKSKFVKLFTKTPPEVLCPHFYELILSNGCPYNCAYCYLQLTFRGDKGYRTFSNSFEGIKKELDAVPEGVFSTGELSDSLAYTPTHLAEVMDYFKKQKERFLLFTTKSLAKQLYREEPSDQIIVSFSINSYEAWQEYEKGTPDPINRLSSADALIQKGWRVRIRLDPIIEGFDYEDICKMIKDVNPERITVGSLRHYPGIYRFTKVRFNAMLKAPDGRLRYTIYRRAKIYRQIENWLGFQPALCKETHQCWKKLGWKFRGCNCSM